MNIFILINSLKIRSIDNKKVNYLIIPFKNIGTSGEKFYKSETIVNDIKMDFSINLIQKAMNYNKDEPSS